MDDKQIQRVLVEVLRRMLPQIGATGERGDVVVVFTGATAGFTEAIQQVRSLIIKGFRVQLIFSRGAELLFGRVIWEQLEGFPFVDPFDDSRWLRTLKNARAVVVPVLSVNTLSKLSLLIADNLASNVVLHALFAGKPLILAQNGVDPSDKGRIEPHFPQCSPLLSSAIYERLEVARGYGCRVVDVSQVSAVLEAALDQKGRPATNGKTNGAAKVASFGHKTKIITAVDVLQAQQRGVPIQLHDANVVTPLARELALKYDVSLKG